MWWILTLLACPPSSLCCFFLGFPGLVSEVFPWGFSLGFISSHPALSLRRRTIAPPRNLFWVLGCWVVVWVKAGYFPGAGGVGYLRLLLRLRPLFVPGIAVPSRPLRLFWIKSIYRPLAPPLPPSLSIPAGDEAYALLHGVASST